MTAGDAYSIPALDHIAGTPCYEVDRRLKVHPCLHCCRNTQILNCKVSLPPIPDGGYTGAQLDGISKEGAAAKGVLGKVGNSITIWISMRTGNLITG